jgi:ribonuclease HII
MEAGREPTGAEGLGPHTSGGKIAGKSKDSFLRILKCTNRYEEIARNEHGAARVCGIDECARGNWCGPTVAAGVILPVALPESLDGKLRDSKLISPKKRAALAEEIKAHAIAWSVAVISSEIIDEIGIHNSVKMAMEEVVHGLSVIPDFILIDSVRIDFELPQLAIDHGDALSVSIAAASILAKTHHTSLMDIIDATYPLYGFSNHKGYGTKEHMEAIQKHGLTPLHRRSFAPIKRYAIERTSRERETSEQHESVH